MLSILQGYIGLLPLTAVQQMYVGIALTIKQSNYANPTARTSNRGRKAAPALTVGGLTLFGVGLADWVLLTTLFYTLLQIAFLLRDRWWKKRKDYHGSK